MNKINLYEFIGIMIGDGCLLDYPKHRIYGIEITGNATEEVDYYDKIVLFLKEEFNLNPRVFVKVSPKGKGLKLIVYNKNLVDFLKQFGFTRNKTYSVKIDHKLMKWDTSKHILRGIFETDGSLYFSKSKVIDARPSYPRLEIKTVSKLLAKQILILLKENQFDAHCHQNGTTMVIYVSGVKMLEKWIKEIGFSSAKNITKYLLWKKQGYYLPKTSLLVRKRLLGI